MTQAPTAAVFESAIGISMEEEATSAPEVDYTSTLASKTACRGVLSMFGLVTLVDGTSRQGEIVADLYANLCVSMLSYTGWMCIL